MYILLETNYLRAVLIRGELVWPLKFPVIGAPRNGGVELMGQKEIRRGGGLIDSCSSGLAYGRLEVLGAALEDRSAGDDLWSRRIKADDVGTFSGIICVNVSLTDFAVGTLDEVC